MKKKILALLGRSFFFLRGRARTIQPIYGDVIVSLQWDLCDGHIFKLNIISYSHCREYCPVDVCRGHFPSSGLPVTFSVGKKLRNWQNCWIYYQWMMTIVLIFFITFHYCLFLSILKFCCKSFILPEDKRLVKHFLVTPKKK